MAGPFISTELMIYNALPARGLSTITHAFAQGHQLSSLDVLSMLQVDPQLAAFMQCRDPDTQQQQLRQEEAGVNSFKREPHEPQFEPRKYTCRWGEGTEKFTGILGRGGKSSGHIRGPHEPQSEPRKYTCRWGKGTGKVHG